MEILLPILAIFISVSAVIITIIVRKKNKDNLAEYRNALQSKQKLLLQLQSNQKNEAETQE